MSNLILNILSPERRLVEKLPVEELTLTGSEGQIQILPGHAPIVGILEPGLFQYRSSKDGVVTGMISSGFFRVTPTKDETEISLMAETLELRSEIDVERAKRAQKKSEDAFRDPSLDEHQFKKYQLKLQRAIIRQQVAAKDH